MASAGNVMAFMDKTVSSPPASARSDPQPYPPLPTHLRGLPRSHTVPPMPNVGTGRPENPAELPGSFPTHWRASFQRGPLGDGYDHPPLRSTQLRKTAEVRGVVSTAWQPTNAQKPGVSENLARGSGVDQITQSPKQRQTEHESHLQQLNVHSQTDGSTLDDLAQLKSAHEVTLRSLRDVHEKAVAASRSYIAVLERRVTNAELLQTHIRQQSAKIEELQTTLDSQQQMLAYAKADLDRYNSLLHHELRRRTRETAERSMPDTPRVEVDVSAVAAEKRKRLIAPSAVSNNSQESQLGGNAEVLEREIEHCIEEIIGYKYADASWAGTNFHADEEHRTEAKAYRKDLRKAQATIERIQNSPSQPPVPPKSGITGHFNGGSIPSTDSPRGRPDDPSPGPAYIRNYDRGLGISMPQPVVRPKTADIGSATMAALLSQTPPPQPRPPKPVDTPLRSKTPLGTHKRLPKPPSVSPIPHFHPGHQRTASASAHTLA